MRYMITHSLLSSWMYAMKDDPYSDSENEPDDPFEDFLRTLRREPSEANEAMQNGIDFENFVTAITLGCHNPEDKWSDAAEKVASYVGGGQLQLVAKKDLNINGVDILLYGRLDCLKAGTVYDIKFSKGYERGKYIDYTQHPVYLELVPEASHFTYIVSNGTDVWTETYRRDETADVKAIIAMFLDWLKANGLLETYEAFWQAS